MKLAYSAKIANFLQTMNLHVSVVDDPFVYINSIVAINSLRIKWIPPFLYTKNNTIYMFSPFSGENFIDDKAILNECRKAEHLAKCLIKKRKKVKIFFITNTIEDIEALVHQQLSDTFGILHDNYDSFIIYDVIKDIFDIKCKILPDVCRTVAESKRMKSTMINKLRSFLKNYLKLQLIGRQEEGLVKKFTYNFLKANKYVSINSGPIEFIRDIETIVAKTEKNIRDHYFHAFNTMLLGLIVIDKCYDLFRKMVMLYGRDIELDFLWVLISLFHDIGHPVVKTQEIDFEAFALGEQRNSERIKQRMQQERNNWWDSEEYQQAVLILDNLFEHIINRKASKWRFDVFPRRKRETPFTKGLKIAFVEAGAHGAVGALQLTGLTKKHIYDIEDSDTREYLYRHMMFAAVSILFHDSRVRDCFRKQSIMTIDAKSFPFSLLLTYMDIIQDDRRDLMISYYKPDIFGDIVYDDATIRAVLDKRSLSPSLKKRLKQQLEGALSFFKMNGLTFTLPEEL